MDENYRDENLLDLSKQKSEFKEFLGKIPNSSVVAFTGAYGSGKSVFLNQIKSEPDEDAEWFEFDAWKYPERQDLWKNFVIDMGDQLGERNSTERSIEGRQYEIWRQIGVISILISLLSSIFKYLPEYKDLDMPDILEFFGTNGFFLIGIFLVCVPMVLSLGLSFKSWFVKLFNDKPINRLDSLQEILTKLLKKIKSKTIYIIVEDIDRSGDCGVYFLETLNYYIKSKQAKAVLGDKKIIVIVPMKEIPDVETSDTKNINQQKKDSHAKCIDYTYTFSLQGVELEDFVKKIFIEEIKSNTEEIGYITSYLEWLFRDEKMNMRTLKDILRNANLHYIAKREIIAQIDWRISIGAEVEKILGDKDWKIKKINFSKNILYRVLLTDFLPEIDGFGHIVNNYREGGVIMIMNLIDELSKKHNFQGVKFSLDAMSYSKKSPQISKMGNIGSGQMFIVANEYLNI